jgi:beta-mannosidase
MTLLLNLAHAAPDNIISLNGRWNLAYWTQAEKPLKDPGQLKSLNAESIGATVPGNVELDLLSAGKIADPMIGNNVYALRKYEGYQWAYSRSFPSPSLQKGQRLELHFGGIDCLASIWLNGHLVGETDNMLIEHEFDVTELLRGGAENELQVIIRSAVIEAQDFPLGVLGIRTDGNSESEAIRKAPHSYGWDIMPRLVSAGLWRGVELRVLDPVRFEDVHWMTTRIDRAAKSAAIYADFQLRVPFALIDGLRVKTALRFRGREVLQRSDPLLSYSGRIPLQVDDAQLWWPRGYGEPAPYEAEMQIVDAAGQVLASKTSRIGLRTVQLDRTETTTPEKPGRFCFVVNGERIFIRGTNWVPLDALHSRDAAQLAEVLEMATELNCNLLRCWGGNVYEDEAFFEACDAEGLLVWQDFAMGCSFYPQNQDFARKVGQEVRSIVRKLRNHPSLALWSGNNEDDVSLNWQLGAFNIDPNRDLISRQVIPAVLYELDPTRPYLPSSPYVSREYYDQGNRGDFLPEDHLWGPRGYYKADFYTKSAAHFVSEIGYHGCPNRSSLERMFDKAAVYPWTKGFAWNEQWLTKSVRKLPLSESTKGRNDLMLSQVRLLFGEVPRDLDTFILASQSVQAEALKYFVELSRSRKFDRSGIIWWNLRDGWPIISDAVVDYYNSRKLAFYFLKNVQATVCLLINDPVNGRYPLVAVNDSLDAARGSVRVSDLASGRELYSGAYAVPANARTTVAELPGLEGQGMLLIRYDEDGHARANHYLYGSPPFGLKTYIRLLKQSGIYSTVPGF